MYCPCCGGVVIFTEGCQLCINCGWSPCGSFYRKKACGRPVQSIGGRSYFFLRDFRPTFA
jgi:hypothetical protein